MGRQRMLNRYLSKIIMDALLEGMKNIECIPEDEKQISYKEAKEVLKYTISELKEKAILK